MGYDTYFEGAIAVRIPSAEPGERPPQLPADWIQHWHTYTAGSGPTTYHEGAPFIAGLDVPTGPYGAWYSANPWRLSNQTMVYDGSQPTWIVWDGDTQRTQRGEYTDALQYLVRCILHDYPDATFEGVITWTGEESDDRGELTVVAGRVIARELHASRYTPEQITALVAACRARRKLDEESAAAFARQQVSAIDAAAYLASAREINEQMDAALAAMGEQ